MFFLVIRHDHPNAELLRAQLKESHRAFLSSLGKSLITGGAIFNENADIIGGTFTFEAENLDAARMIAHQDPYVQHPEIGLTTTIIPCRIRWKDGVFYDGEGFNIKKNGAFF